MKTRNENLIIDKEDAHNLPVGSKYYKAVYMDDLGEHSIDTIGRFRSMEDLNEYCQQWCYDEIDDYEQAIKIVTYEIMDSGKFKCINKEIVWFGCIEEDD